MWYISRIAVAVSMAVGFSWTVHADEIQSTQKSSKIIKAKNPILTIKQFGKDKGIQRSLFLIEINPFYASEILNKGEALKNREGEKYLSEDRSIKNSIAEAAQKIATESPGIFEDYASPLLPDYTAWLSNEELISISEDSRFSRITELDSSPIAKNATRNAIISDTASISATQKTTPAGWPWSYVGADASFSSNNVYIIEGKITGAHSNFNTEVNKEYIENYYSNFSNPIDELYHTVHIASVIGGRGNIVRGINPGQKVYIYGRSEPGMLEGYPDIATSQNRTRWAILQAMAAAESKNEYSSLSVSINQSGNVNEHYFRESGLWGVSLRQASNRFFVTQSAGQNAADACNYAYVFRGVDGSLTARKNDGIMVVSGIKPTGEPWQNNEGSNPIPGQPSDISWGPNSGVCVEAWAPGFDIPGLSYGNGGVRLSTGTSYSAPIVAAIASRYSSSYRPIQKEQIIRNHLNFNNKYHNGSPIYEIRYTSTTGAFPRLVNPVKIYAFGTSQDLSYKLRNGKYYLPTSGDWYYSSGNAIQDLVIDMGSSNNSIYGVRITPVASDYDINGSYSITYGNDPNNLPIGTSTTEPHIATFAPIFISANGTKSRYLRIRVNIPSAYSGISEVEVYSNPI